jgi:MFS family permease
VHDALSALRIRPFRMLFAGQAVSFVGDAIFPVALAFAVLDELDGTAGQLGIVLAAGALPMAILVLAAGVWADRLPRQRIMLASDLGRCAVQVVLAALLIGGQAELWMLIVLHALYGVFEAGFRPAAGGLVPQVVGPDRLQQANALMGLAQNIGLVLGPSVAGLLIVAIGPGSAIAVDAGTFVVSAAFLLALGPTEAPKRDEHADEGFWAELRGGVAEVRKRRWMWSFMPAFTAYHLLALPGVLALGPVISDRELNGASSWATIVTCFGIGTILGGVASLRIHPARPMLACTLCIGAAAAQPLILAYAGSTAAIAALELLAGIAVTAGFTQWDTTLGREIPPHALSRVTSLDWFTTVGAMPLGFAGVAAVAGAIGTRTTLTIAGLTVMVLCLACLAVGDVQRLRRNTDPPEPVLAS